MLSLLPVVIPAILLVLISDSQSSYFINDRGTKEYIYKEKLFFTIMVILLSVFVGLRIRGNDTSVYRQQFESLGVGFSQLRSINWGRVSGAPGLVCWCIILKTLGCTSQDYLMITAIVTISIYLWFIRKYTCNLKLSVFYFITMGVYGFTFAAIKQTFAVAFLMLATDAALEKRWAKYIFFIFIAQLFHPYAFIYLVIPFLQFTPWSNRTYILLSATAAVAFALSSFMPLIDSITEGLGYNYSEGSFSGDGVNIFRVMVVWVPTILSWIYRIEIKENGDRIWNIIVNLSMMVSVIMFVGLFGTANYFARLANYFLIFQVLALPWLLGFCRGGNRSNITMMSILGFILYYIYAEGINFGGFDKVFTMMPFSEYLWSVLERGG